jgi:hypothetical protein
LAALARWRMRAICRLAVVAAVMDRMRTASGIETPRNAARSLSRQH